MTQEEQSIDAMESDRSDRRCNVLVPAFVWCVVVATIIAWVWLH